MVKKKYYQRPDGLYETSRTVNGRRVVFRGRTIAEVDKKILDFNVQQTQGRTMEVIAAEWLEKHQSEVSVGTMACYTRACNHFTEYFGGKHAGAIKPTEVRRYIKSVEDEGKSRQTCSIYLCVAKMIFAHAVLSGDIDSSPAAEVKLSRGLPVSERRALTMEQEQAVAAYRGEHWLYGVMLLYTGCRKGELLALTWQDIDQANGIIHINKKINYAYSPPRVEDRLKSKNSRRDIPLLAPLAALLPRGRRIGRIFCNADGSPLTLYQTEKMWREYQAGIGCMDDVSPHCFRHSYATICYEAGIDSMTAAAFLGDTEEVTRDIYTDLRNNHKAISADKLNAHLAARGL